MGHRFLRDNEDRGLVLLHPGARPAESDRIRLGADVLVAREPGAGWRVEGEPDIEGLRDASDAWPWASGRGVVWRDEGWLYRTPLGGMPRAIGACGRTTAVRVGAAGAVLLGDGENWYFAAPADGSVRPVPEPLDAEDEVAVAWALEGCFLGGPGGVVWDLERGRANFEAPRLLGSLVLPTEGAWMTVDAAGQGVWLNPRTGETTAAFELPLEPEDAPSFGAAEGSQAVVHTEEGHRFLVRGSSVTTSRREAVPRGVLRSGPGWSLVRGELRVEGQPPVGFGFAAATRVGRWVYGWRSDGLLVAVRAVS